MAKLRCPRCRSDSLSIREITGTTDYGVVEVVDGHLVPPSEFYFEPGLIAGVYLSCGQCGHQWTSRLSVAP